MSDGIDYKDVLADLKAQREKIDQAIVGIEAMLGLQSSNGANPFSPAFQTTVTEDSFLGMSVPVAAIAYLKMVKKPQATSEIGDALRQGGIHSTSDKFNNTVYAALHRSDKAIRLGKKWSLKEWHPGARTLPKRMKSQDDDSVAAEADEDPLQ